MLFFPSIVTIFRITLPVEVFIDKDGYFIVHNEERFVSIIFGFFAIFCIITTALEITFDVCTVFTISKNNEWKKLSLQNQQNRMKFGFWVRLKDQSSNLQPYKKLYIRKDHEKWSIFCFYGIF
jgi:hypothetical protein